MQDDPKPPRPAPKAELFRFRKYDIGSDEIKESSRWATYETIAKYRAEIISDMVVVHFSQVEWEPGEVGLTVRGYNPHPKP
jgi:hypothetical protein